MAKRDPDILTVSPPTFDRMAFAEFDQMLAGPEACHDREWVMARLSEGLQIKMLRGEQSGYVMFQPGRLAWRPVLDAEKAVVVQGFRVGADGDHTTAADQLWSVVEGFARYYGYASVLYARSADQIGKDDGIETRDGWVVIDETDDGTELWAQILQGPMLLPQFPKDFALRALQTGPGVTVQTTGETADCAARIARLRAGLARYDIPLRVDRFKDAADLRARAVASVPDFAVLVDGLLIGDSRTEVNTILKVMAAAG